MKTPRLMEAPAWGVWIAFTILLLVSMTGLRAQRSVAESYLRTAEVWWAGHDDIYTEGIAGFLYLPQSVWAFTPFTWLGRGLSRDGAHALWRLFGVALFAFGIRRFAKHCPGAQAGETFALATLLVLSASVASAKTGQSNLHLSACMLHAGVELLDRRWWRATAFLWLGMAMKPLALVMILLAGALHRPMRSRLAVAALAFAALPFAHPDLDYVWRQYGLGLEKILRSSQPGEKPYADIVGLLRAAGIPLAPAFRTALQAGAALGTLWLCATALRRRGHAAGTLWLVALAAGYLVLFNPRTETNSYVLLAPHVALAASALWLTRRRHTAVLAAAAALLLGCDNYGRTLHEWSSPWLKPLVALLLATWAVARLLRHRSGPSRSDAATPHP